MDISKDLKIEIRPIPNAGDIKKFSKELEYFSPAKVIPPLVNAETMKYETGLSEEDVNYLKRKGFPYNIDDQYINGVAHEFWESPIVKMSLPNTPTFLYPGRNLIDFVKYKYILVHKEMYPSEEAMIEGGRSEATHYVYNEAEAVKIKATKISSLNAIKQEVAKLSITTKKHIILLILNEDMDNKSEEVVVVKLDNIIKNKEQRLLLEEYVTLSSEELGLKAIISLAIKMNVLKNTAKGIYFFETNLGFNREKVYETLKTPEHQEVLNMIKSKIKK